MKKKQNPAPPVAAKGKGKLFAIRICLFPSLLVVGLGLPANYTNRCCDDSEYSTPSFDARNSRTDTALES